MTKAVIPIINLSILKISGEDAENFLQGQLTADITQLKNNWSFAGYCSPKGRLLALFKAWKQQDNFYLLLPKELVETIQKRLTMFVLRSKVEIENITTNIYGFIGSNCYDEVAENLNLKPSANSTVTTDNKNTIIKVNDQRCILVTSEEQKSNSYKEQPEHTWFDADVENGYGQVFTATSEMFVPQMMNLDLLGGVSFKKGCYTGQEIVARMHYLGKLKQRMYKIQLSPGSEKIEIGDAIQNTDKKNAGNIILIQHRDNSPVYALAVMRKEYLDQSLNVNGAPIKFDENSQPYEID